MNRVLKVASRSQKWPHLAHGVGESVRPVPRINQKHLQITDNSVRAFSPAYMLLGSKAELIDLINEGCVADKVCRRFLYIPCVIQPNAQLYYSLHRSAAARMIIHCRDDKQCLLISTEQNASLFDEV